MPFWYVGFMKLETYLSNKTITQTAFAEKIGVTQAALSRYMQGKRKVPLGVIAKVQTATKGAVTFKDWLASSEAPSKQTEGV